MSSTVLPFNRRGRRQVADTDDHDMQDDMPTDSRHTPHPTPRLTRDAFRRQYVLAWRWGAVCGAVAGFFAGSLLVAGALRLGLLAGSW
jgi:hypothetical protein